MDVVLHTHLSNPALAWHNLERWEESVAVIPAGWRSTLVVRSGAFAAQLPFYFDDAVLASFLRDLRAMDRAISGTATLATPNEDPYVRLTVGHAGQVAVSGLLIDEGVVWQRLEFEFGTDQTVLRSLADDFQGVWDRQVRSSAQVT